jgi:ankyrin repeat protein
MASWYDRVDDAILEDDVSRVRELLSWWNLPTGFSRILSTLTSASAKDRNSWLHVAAYSNSWNVAQLLIEMNEDVNNRNLVGDTPLHLAAKYNSWETADRLISGGADLNIVNQNGESPLDLARQLGHTSLVELLELVMQLS